MWYNLQSITKILSLAEVHHKYCVTMDTTLKASMYMHRSNCSIVKFREYKSGLYYHDIAAPNINSSSGCVNRYFFIVTIAGNKHNQFHHCEIEAADQAHTLYTMIGRQSQQQFKHIINNNLISNCLVISDNA